MSDRPCPACSSATVSPSKQRHPWDSALALVWPVEPATCETCGQRFYQRSSEIGGGYRIVTWLALGLVAIWAIFANVGNSELDATSTAARNDQGLTNVVENETTEISELVASLQQARLDLRDARKSFTEADQANGELLQARADIEIKLARLIAKNQDLEAEMVQLKAENVRAQSEPVSQTINEQSKQAQTDIEPQLGALRSENTKLQNELQRVTMTYDQTKTELVENIAKLAETEQQLTSLRQTASEQESLRLTRTEAAQSAVTNSKQELAEVHSENLRLNDELRVAATKNTKIEAAFANKVEELARLHQRLDEATLEKSQIETLLADKDKELAESNKKLFVLQQTSTEQTSAVTGKEQELSALKFDNINLKQQLASVTQEKNDIDSRLSALTSELSETNQQLVHLAQSNTEQKSSDATRQQELNVLQNENSDLKRLLENAIQEKGQIEARLALKTEALYESEEQLAVLLQQTASDQGTKQLVQAAMVGTGVTGRSETNPAIRQKVSQTLEQWRKAWSEKQIDNYLSHYSKQFVPANGGSSFVWQSLRRHRLLQPQFIRLSIDSMRLAPVADDRIQARFVQQYESDTYSDTVEKVLELVLEDSDWKIISEQSVN